MRIPDKATGCSLIVDEGVWQSDSKTLPELI